MKKKYIQLGAAAVVLAVMVGLLMLLRNPPAESEQGDATPEDAVHEIGSGDIPFYSMKITNSSGTYELVKDRDDPESGFIVKGWEKLSLDTYNLGLAEGSAKAMTVKEVITENASEEDLAMFGLDDPLASVKIEYETGGPGTLLFGDNAPGGEGVYVMIKGDSIVYLVMPSQAEPFFKPAVAYVNKTVTATDPEFKGFDRIALSGTDYPEPIIIERTPETAQEIGGMSFNTHSIVSPIRAGVDYQRGMEPLSSVYGLLAYDVAAVTGDGDSLAPYGLDEPRAVISVTGPAGNPDMTFTLRVSAADGDGNVKVMKDGSPVVYEMPESSLGWLGLTVFDYMDRMPLVPNIDTVSSVKVTVPGKTYTFTLTGEGDGLKVSLDGTELPEVTGDDGSKASGAQNFRQFYQTLICATYQEETDDAPPENAEPSVRVEYSYRSGVAPDSLSLYPGPTRRAFITVNGGPFYLTASAYMDRVIEDAGKIASGEAVKSYL